MAFNQPNILDDPDDLGPPPDRAPELRREEFIDVGPQGIRSLINYDNDVQSVTFEEHVYPVQLDANNKKFIEMNGQRYFKVEQPTGPLLEAMATNGGRIRSRRRKSKRSRKSRWV
jgi:hypothetical protein